MRKRFQSLLLAPLGVFLFLLLLVVGACSSDEGVKSVGNGDGGPGNPAVGDGDLGTGDGDSVATGDGDTGTPSSASTACSGQCVDLLTDANHCGACGTICEAGTQCKSGSCEGCAAGQSDCSGSCVNTQTDPNNCGACGTKCSLGAKCVAGACETCEGNQEECGGVCVDTNTNPRNCGACGTVCTGTQVCAGGSCIDNTCGGANELPCGASGACVDVVNNKEHCGACGQACPGDMACIPADGVSRCGCYTGEPCNGICTGTAYDKENCGGCGIKCHAAQYCDNGSCACGGSQVLCDGACKNPDQCGVSGGIGALVGPRELSLPDRSLQIIGPAPGDGSVECVGGTSGGSGGGSSAGTGGMSGGDVGTNTDAGAHCGGGDWIQGKSTWYELATPLVHCSYETSSLPMFYGAINDAQYAAGDVCGACVEIQANGKTLEVQIVDECPYVGNETWCYAGSNHIDLNPAAFEYFEPRVTGVFEMQWRYVPCSSPGALEYTFKQGSSIYWTGIMIRNHPVPLASVEVAGPDGVFRSLERQEYNYWLLESGFGRGPYTLRVTDTSGAVLEKSGIPELPGSEMPANMTTPFGAQLASCN